MSSPTEDAVMKRVLVVFATVAAILGAATAPRVQTAIASDESPFQFQFEQSEGPRGLAIEGYVYNPLPWRIHVRLRVDSFDGDGTRVASASGWVLGDVPARGRGYFYVPVSAPATTYRPSVQRFDKVMLEVQAP
jgi:hypothetical protein